MSSRMIGFAGCLTIAVASIAAAALSEFDGNSASLIEISDADAAKLVGGCSTYRQMPPPPLGYYYVCTDGIFNCPIANPVQAVGSGYESAGQILCGACGLNYSGPMGFCGL